MKKNELGFLFLFVLLITLSFVQANNHSKYFKEIVFQEGGDFVGVNLGISAESVQFILPVEGLEVNHVGFLYYSWQLESNRYSLDFYFKEDRLVEIEGYVTFNNDLVAMDNLHLDMLAFFTNKFGKGVDKNFDGQGYTSWNQTDFEVVLNKSSNEVYWSIISLLERSDPEEVAPIFLDEPDPTPIFLKDLKIDKDEFYGLSLGDLRDKVASSFEKSHLFVTKDSALQCDFELGVNSVSVRFDFNMEEKVVRIEGSVDFPYYYNTEENLDYVSEKEKFYHAYSTLADSFFGERKEESLSNGAVAYSWYFNGKKLILNADKDSVYFTYSYSE